MIHKGAWGRLNPVPFTLPRLYKFICRQFSIFESYNMGLGLYSKPWLYKDVVFVGIFWQKNNNITLLELEFSLP